MEPEHSQISPFLSAGLFFLVHAALLAFCGWIKSWWNEPLGIDGFVLFVALSFIIQLFSPPTKADEPLALSVKNSSFPRGQRSSHQKAFDSPLSAAHSDPLHLMPYIAAAALLCLVPVSQIGRVLRLAHGLSKQEKVRGRRRWRPLR
jgi:hypothetical protein